MKQPVSLNIAAIASMIGLAALSRLLPHPPNFTAVGAMALFGAAYLSPRWISFAIPFVALWISDLFINNLLYASYFESFVWFFNPSSYLAFGLIILSGSALLKKVKFTNVVAAGFTASLIFFIVSNFASWMGNPLYPQTGSGLLTCYAAGIPFFWNTLAGDLSFGLLMFGSFEWIRKVKPSWIEA